MAVIKIKKLIGSSSKSFEDALGEIIKCAVGQKENVTGAKILDKTVRVENGKITEYKVTANIAYLWKKELRRK